MKKLTLALATLLFVSPLFAQIQESAFLIRTFTSFTAAAAEGGFLQPQQQDRAAWLPVRVIAAGGGNDIVYILIHQASVNDTPTLEGFATTSSPSTGGVSGNCEFSLRPYEVYEFNSYALSRAFYDAIIGLGKPHAYGPLATPRGTYIIVYPPMGIVCHS